MDTTTKLSVADAKDRHARIAALGLLAFAFKYLADSLVHFVDPDLSQWLGWTADGLNVVAVLLIVPIYFWKLRKLDREQRRAYFSDESFTADRMRRAFGVSISATFIVAIFLEVASKRIPEVPSAFFLQVVLFTLLGSLAVSFLVLTRDDTETPAGA